MKGKQCLRPFVLALFSLVALLLLTSNHASTSKAAPNERQTAFSPPYLVKNIDPRTYGSFPLCVAAGDAYAVCTADDGLPGQRVWRSDGTQAGTSLLEEIFDGEGDVDIRNSAATESGKLFFVAKAGCCQYEVQLWQTDGTSAGTVMVKELDFSWEPRSLVTVGETLYFLELGDQIDSFGALWKSDGTEAGTESFFEFSSAIYDVSRTLAAKDGQIYFQNRSTANGTELWVTDGSAAGAKMLIDIRPGEDSSNPERLTTVGQYVYFSADDGTHGRELWRTDGTPAGTKMIRDFRTDLSLDSDPDHLTAVDDLLYFTVHDDEGTALWRTDGTDSGTVRLTGNLHLEESLVAADGLVYFEFHDYESNKQYLGRSDGTPVGTFPVMEIYEYDPMNGEYLFCQSGRRATASGSSLYFAYATLDEGCELWVSDGTATGTRLVRDIRAGSASSHVAPLAAVNNRMLLRVVMYEIEDIDLSGDDTELWVTDGSAAGTKLLLNINRMPLSSNPSTFTYFNNKLYFAADDGVHGSELWSSDGSEIGTKIVADLRTVWGGSSPGPIAVSGNVLVFAASATSQQELYSSDGTEAGTHVINSLTEGTDYALVKQMVEWNDYVFFTVKIYPDEVYEFWRTDGSAAGTMRLGDFYVPRMIPAESKLYFIKRDVPPGGAIESAPNALGVTDGTHEGTELLDNLPVHNCGIGEMAVSGDALFFVWCDDERDYELWYLASPTAQPGRVKDINPHGSSMPREFAIFEGSLYFTADDGEHGNALWISDGTESQTEMLNAIPAYNITPNSVGIFFLSDGLWFGDGTVGGTKKIADFFYLTTNLVIGADHLFFGARDGDDINLMVSDGTKAGTGVIGERGLDPRLLYVANGSLFFSAVDEWADRELWALNLQDLLKADFSASPKSGDPPLDVNFTNLSIGDFDSCMWDFGDGSTSELCIAPSHSYSTPGTFTVALSVDGPVGNDTVTKASYITVYEPVKAHFTATPKTGVRPLVVDFTNLSTGDFDQCLWDFGDDNISESCDNPSHTYSKSGIYSVSLEVQGLGGDDKTTRADYIAVYEPPIADFSASPENGAPPLTVEFTNLSTGDFDQCLWDFGDGRTRITCGNPTVKFREEGHYTISLTVNGPGGEDTNTVDDCVEVAYYQLFLPTMIHK